MTVTVLIADDHGFTLNGMQQVLEAEGFVVVSAVSGGVEAVAMARKLQPKLAVLDFSMPDATGVEVFHDIMRWSPKTKVAIVTGVVEDETLRHIVAAGVRGLFRKGQDLSEICEGLHAVVRGECIYPDDVTDAAPKVSLSARETEVLNQIARGLTNASIAKELSISPKTVEAHRASLMRKFGVHSTASLVVAAVRSGHLLL